MPRGEEEEEDAQTRRLRACRGPRGSGCLCVRTSLVPGDGRAGHLLGATGARCQACWPPERQPGRGQPREEAPRGCLPATPEAHVRALRCSVFSSLPSSLFSVLFGLLQRTQIQPRPGHAWPLPGDGSGLLVGFVLRSGQDLVIVGVWGHVTGAQEHLFRIIFQSPGQGRAGRSCTV